MRAQKRSGTAQEIAVRRWLSRGRFSFETNAQPSPELRSRADIVLRGKRIAVFLDGCFWHCCPAHMSSPKANRRWWRAKLDANRRRDVRTSRALRARGWTVLRFWEHDDAERVIRRVARFARAPGRSRRTGPGRDESRPRSIRSPDEAKVSVR